ncbi:MAG: hypothetical protein LUC16_03290 [Coprobacillus sp.]|nr:hypothetical protein [Coprobacillus sp.]
MKKKTYTALALISIAPLCLTSCSPKASTLLFSASSLPDLSSVYNQGETGYIVSAEKDFSYALGESIPYDIMTDNSVISPLSAYISLFEIYAMSGDESVGNVIYSTSEDSSSSDSGIMLLDDEDIDSDDEETDDEDSDATSEEIEEEESDPLLDYQTFLYKLTFSDRTGSSRTSDSLRPFSALFLSSDTSYNEDSLSYLADSYFIDSYSIDYSSESASKEINKYLKDKTRGNIKSKYIYSEDSAASLLTNMYFTANWSNDAGNLKYDGKHVFKSADGTTTKTKFLRGEYSDGQVISTEKYSSFFTTTANDRFAIKFIVPSDGYSISDILTCEVLEEVNSLSRGDEYRLGDYNKTDFTTNTKYYTRCIFPEFSASSELDVAPLLKKSESLDITSVSLSSVSDCLSLDSLVQTNSFNVTKKGIDGYGSVGYSLVWIDDTDKTYTKEYLDFIIDKPFVYILTNEEDIPIYIGYVNNI